MTIEPRAYRDTLGRVPTGVTVITAAASPDRLYGVTIGSFSSLSLKPPLVLFSLDKTALCHPAFIACERFAVNVLAEDQSELSGIFASKSPDRPWHSVRFRRGEHSGAPLLEGCVAWLECEREAVHPGGDHDIIIGRVLGLDQSAAGQPLIHFGGAYRRLDLAADVA